MHGISIGRMKHMSKRCLRYEREQQAEGGFISLHEPSSPPRRSSGVVIVLPSGVRIEVY